MDIRKIPPLFKGTFVAEPSVIHQKMSGIRAFVFDWDGVFNNGSKTENASSPFSEIDSMGINMLRFQYYRHTGTNPATAIITGEDNKAAYAFATRERIHSVYFRIRNKKEALEHFCAAYNLEPHNIAYFFDDVLDLPIAEICGLRMVIGRGSNPLFTQLVQEQHLADYITAHQGGDNGLREATELLMGLGGNYYETIMQRVQYSTLYQEYLAARNLPTPAYFSQSQQSITPQSPL